MKSNNLIKLIRLSIFIGFAALCISAVMGSPANARQNQFENKPDANVAYIVKRVSGEHVLKFGEVYFTGRSSVNHIKDTGEEIKSVDTINFPEGTFIGYFKSNTSGQFGRGWRAMVRFVPAKGIDVSEFVVELPVPYTVLGVESFYGRKLAVTRDASGTVYVAVLGYDYVRNVDEMHLFKSVDLGMTWTGGKVANTNIGSDYHDDILDIAVEEAAVPKIHALSRLNVFTLVGPYQVLTSSILLRTIDTSNNQLVSVSTLQTGNACSYSNSHDVGISHSFNTFFASFEAPGCNDVVNGSKTNLRWTLASFRNKSVSTDFYTDQIRPLIFYATIEQPVSGSMEKGAQVMLHHSFDFGATWGAPTFVTSSATKSYSAVSIPKNFLAHPYLASMFYVENSRKLQSANFIQGQTLGSAIPIIVDHLEESGAEIVEASGQMVE